ncbi:hypothetical protein RFI_37165 [Reticulomyxa filosa]|uniref:Uncharacterized protein n=1 Tax=Reticulomyxa filosa TaxID=46433 RepID=X6LGN6_RETFI|nr:hypothetical protein RFI_37165 [Reticulomyxa filosa]|eukprot:ETO00282.1 hypothetical protein RFI_37165 [Reticulomyxa filosa]
MEHFTNFKNNNNERHFYNRFNLNEWNAKTINNGRTIVASKDNEIISKSQMYEAFNKQWIDILLKTFQINYQHLAFECLFKEIKMQQKMIQKFEGCTQISSDILKLFHIQMTKLLNKQIIKFFK